jgi:hypothetical protein
VADEKFILLKSCTAGSNLSAHISTEEVLAVPDPPISRTPFWTKAVEECVGLGWVKILLTRYSTLKESKVGRRS